MDDGDVVGASGAGGLSSVFERDLKKGGTVAQMPAVVGAFGLGGADDAVVFADGEAAFVAAAVEGMARDGEGVEEDGGGYPVRGG